MNWQFKAMNTQTLSKTIHCTVSALHARLYINSGRNFYENNSSLRDSRGCSQMLWLSSDRDTPYGEIYIHELLQ